MTGWIRGSACKVDADMRARSLGGWWLTTSLPDRMHSAWRVQSLDKLKVPKNFDIIVWIAVDTQKDTAPCGDIITALMDCTYLIRALNR